jgi:DNA-binding CsgD family transcriptional regulator/predicted ester cyclase
MNTKKMIALVRRLFEEQANRGSISLYEDIFFPELIIHGPASNQETHGIPNAKKLDHSYFKAYQGMKFTIEDIQAIQDKVFVRWICRGKHAGKFKGIHPKNPEFSIAGLSIYRMLNGKIREIWQYWDRLGLLEQIGEVRIQSPVEPGYYHNILKSLDMEKYLEGVSFLTQRERDCLQCLLEGKTAKETANLYKLSHRTVESYFEKIKRKLNCRTKRDLFTAAQILEKLELL